MHEARPECNKVGDIPHVFHNNELAVRFENTMNFAEQYFSVGRLPQFVRRHEKQN